MPSYRTAFISHAHTDNSRCARIVALLKSKGIDTWIDLTNAQQGHDLSEEINDQLEQRTAFVLMVTATSNASPWVRQERSAYNMLVNTPKKRLVSGVERIILPVRLSDEIPTILGGILGIDAQAKPDEQVAEEIAIALIIPERNELLELQEAANGMYQYVSREDFRKLSQHDDELSKKFNNFIDSIIQTIEKLSSQFDVDLALGEDHVQELIGRQALDSAIKTIVLRLEGILLGVAGVTPMPIVPGMPFDDTIMEQYGEGEPTDDPRLINRVARVVRKGYWVEANGNFSVICLTGVILFSLVRRARK